jgi:hypothetical protein
LIDIRFFGEQAFLQLESFAVSDRGTMQSRQGFLESEAMIRTARRSISEKGRPGIETRFAIGLLLLKHIYRLFDEGVCEHGLA